MKEKALCQRLKNSEIKALEAVIDRYSGYVITVVRNFSRGALSKEDIDDVCSEVFFRLWRCRENIDTALGLCAYLSAVARNAVKDRFKKTPPPSADISELEIPSDFSVEEAAELGEMIRCLRAGLETLPEDERDIFMRYFFYGESSAEIAEDARIPDSTVRTKLYRTRAKLRKYLSERGYDHV